MTPQSAIIPDSITHAIWLEADILDRNRIQKACIASLDALAELQQRYPHEQLGLTIAFGADFWHSLNRPNEARELKNFPSYGKGLAPATQHDLMFHIQSTHHDSNFTLAQALVAAFGDAIAIKSEEHGFRRHEERGLDGFVDGTDNPKEIEKIRAVGTIAEGEADAGGSYVLLQKYRHDLAKWQSYSVEEQEEAIARNKISNDKLPKDERHPRSHIVRSNLKENGVGLKIIRRSLPFGKVSGEHGLMFIAYCARLHNIEAQLISMFGDSEDGLTDLLLERLSTAITGAYYFAPSIERLRDL